MRILLTNDDGYKAEGLKLLYDALAARHEVVVSAPEREQSGVGHAFTFNEPLTYETLSIDCGMRGYRVAGTPSDSVKFALGHLLERKPECVVSGLNIGENSGISSIYSGTVAAAREGAFWGVLSFAFSVCVPGRPHAAAYAAMAPALLDSIAAVAKNGLHGNNNRTFFNVNFPPCDPAACRGVRITRQSLAFFDDHYRHEHGASCENYWVYGEKVGIEESDDFDSRAIMNNYIAVTPMHFDATADAALENLKVLEQR
jgi:5'-nucleotidase